jgi:magnesium transporter
VQNIISYNEHEVRRGGSKDDVSQGYNVWVDLSDPTPAELQNVQESFHIDYNALEEYSNKSKRAQVRILGSHIFTLMIEIKYGPAQTLTTEGIYMFLGSGWLVTIHSSEANLMAVVKRILEERSRPLIESSVDALYYSILSITVDKYESNYLPP